MCVGTHAPCVLFRCHALVHVVCVESFKVGLKALMCVHVIIVCVFKLITVYSVPTSIPVKLEPGPVSFL